MPCPKKKHSHSRSNIRRSANFRVKLESLNDCPQCKAPKLPHRVCGECGFYNNELIVIKKEKKKKKEEGTK